MKRRTVLQSALGLSALPALAQASFPAGRERELRALAAAVLPSSLGRKGTDAAATRFTRWVREYQPAAEMGPGYGSPSIRHKPPSPAQEYLRQLEQLSSVLLGSDAAAKRNAIAAAVKAAGVRDLTGFPEGRHIATDLMTHWFQSVEANDLAYEAVVGKDQCRTLADSSSAPRPLKGASRRAAL